MYAPKLQPLTRDERWQLGFDYRIDRRAAEIMDEIKAMADKARVELGLVEPVTADQVVISADLMRAWMAPANYGALIAQQQAAGIQNSYPLGGMQAGANIAGLGFGGAFGNPFA